MTIKKVFSTLLDEKAGIAELSRKKSCWCYNCLDKITDERGWKLTMNTFIVCPDCGNKRCPKSTDHNYACTNSNEPGQTGSRYQ